MRPKLNTIYLDPKKYAPDFRCPFPHCKKKDSAGQNKKRPTIGALRFHVTHSHHETELPTGISSNPEPPAQEIDFDTIALPARCPFSDCPKKIIYYSRDKLRNHLIHFHPESVEVEGKKGEEKLPIAEHLDIQINFCPGCGISVKAFKGGVCPVCKIDLELLENALNMTHTFIDKKLAGGKT